MSESHEVSVRRKAALPTYYIPHGGGPWPFVPELAVSFGPLTPFLQGLIADVGTPPRAIVVVSAHWEAPLATVSARSDYSMLYDYSNFPKHTYSLQYPAPGSLAVAGEVVAALQAAKIPVATESGRGYDHGVFVPLMVIAPKANIPIIPLSLVEGLDPAQHFALGQALAPLRRDNVLIIGSGMSFHNLGAIFGGQSLHRADRFDTWLNETATGDPAARGRGLAAWASAPEARFSHPAEEHLLPLMVAAGAADGDAGTRVFHDELMGAKVSAFRFG